MANSGTSSSSNSRTSSASSSGERRGANANQQQQRQRQQQQGTEGRATPGDPAKRPRSPARSGGAVRSTARQAGPDGRHIARATEAGTEAGASTSAGRRASPALASAPAENAPLPRPAGLARQTGHHSGSTNRAANVATGGAASPSGPAHANLPHRSASSQAPHQPVPHQQAIPAQGHGLPGAPGNHGPEGNGVGQEPPDQVVEAPPISQRPVRGTRPEGPLSETARYLDCMVRWDNNTLADIEQETQFQPFIDGVLALHDAYNHDMRFFISVLYDLNFRRSLEVFEMGNLVQPHMSEERHILDLVLKVRDSLPIATNRSRPDATLLPKESYLRSLTLLRTLNPIGYQPFLPICPGEEKNFIIKTLNNWEDDSKTLKFIILLLSSRPFRDALRVYKRICACGDQGKQLMLETLLERTPLVQPRPN